MVSRLKFTKGHNSVKNVGGVLFYLFIIIIFFFFFVLCTSSDDALYLYFFYENISKGSRVTERTPLPKRKFQRVIIL